MTVCRSVYMPAQPDLSAGGKDCAGCTSGIVACETDCVEQNKCENHVIEFPAHEYQLLEIASDLHSLVGNQQEAPPPP